MAVSTAVGTFSQKTTTGTQAVTGLAFQPKALIVWTGGSSAASGTFQASFAAGTGFVDSSLNQFCSAAASTNAQTASQNFSRQAVKAISLVNGAGTLVCEANVQSLDAAGFTLNFTTTDATARVFCYMAIGGADITNTSVGQWNPTAAAGNVTCSGPGFQPDLVLWNSTTAVTAPPVQGAGYWFPFGFFNAAGQQAVVEVHGANAANPTITNRVQRNDAAFCYSNNAPAIYDLLSFVAMTAQGFTMNFQAGGNLDGSASYINYLAIKGVSSRIGVLDVPSATGNQTIAHTGFAPRGILFGNISWTPTASVQSSTVIGIGASDTSSSASIAMLDANGITPSRVDSVFENTNSCLIIDGTPSVVGAGNVSSTNSDGFVINWTATSAGIEMVYCAIGDAGVNTFPRTLP